ncbi:ComEC/Rec2 family competence protein [Adhaeribacter rhizoryzae]|uniref:MBL fold metallo-hydrolase n=1 Tax=Adhaeribacter rhizoryzae TaxID=2607907 RepID=A0A5M6DKT8_9BACT|nr:MBL fold metallo-hydrolase [Adhaeribacter rhizoryzae]KAA5548144.1 MBL fold metallo-hydrolase [Adhaeribacter rhizoryzae]
MKKNRVLFAGLFAASVLVSGFTVPLLRPEPPKNIVAAAATNLTMYWIDTEGGAATLIVTPAGESILIDAGNPGGRDSERIFQVARNVAGLKQIDHLVTTHWHIDHYGGAAELAAKIPIVEVIDKGVPASLTEDRNFAQNIQPYKDMAVKKRSLIKPNGTIPLQKLAKGLPNLTIKFVGVDKQFVTVAKNIKNPDGCETTTDKATDTSDNANSMVLVMDYGPFRFFDGGDLTWNIEKNLVCPTNLVGTVDVFQVNHHGLDQSNNPVLIKNLAPTVSIMNNGTRKGCGPETVTTLRNTPSIQAAYQLHKNIRQDSEFNTQEGYIANLEENCKANFIKLTVAPDGKKYAVSIPATKHEKTFITKTIH